MDMPPAAIEANQPAKRPIKIPDVATIGQDKKVDSKQVDRGARLKEISQLVAKKATDIKGETLKRLKNPKQWDPGAYQYLQAELVKLGSTPQFQELVYTTLTTDPDLKKVQQRGEFIFGDKTILDTTPKPGSLAAKKAKSEQMN